MNKKKFIILLLFIIIFSINTITFANNQENLKVGFFWGRECYKCTKMQMFIYNVKKEYPNIQVDSYEVLYNKENLKYFNKVLKNLGKQNHGVPTIIIGDKIWVGYNDRITSEIKNYIEKDTNKNKVSTDNSVLKSIITKVDSIYLITVLIAFIDGFNPCSLWVLTYLLSLLITFSNKKRSIILVGFSFLFMSSLVYGSFILGLFNIINIIKNNIFIKLIIITITLFIGIVNIKDYLFLQKGISFSIPVKWKPKIIKKLNVITKKEKGFFIGTTLLLSAGITLLELPCTAGFPVIWTNIVNDQNILSSQFYILLLLYLFIYFIIEIVIIIMSYFILDITKINKKYTQKVKLISGSLMISLGSILIINKDLLSNTEGLIYIVIITTFMYIIMNLLKRLIS